MGQVAHLRHYAAIEGCEVVALAESRRETGERVARAYGIPRRYDSGEEMLAAERLDGVVAAQPYRRYALMLPEVLAAVPHVFSEKPLCYGSTSGAELVAAARAAGSVHMIGYHKRCDPGVRAAREQIRAWTASGQLGALRYVRATLSVGDWLERADTKHIDAGDPRPTDQLEQLPASVPPALEDRYEDLVNLHVHSFNLIRFLLGEPYSLESVSANGSLYTGESVSGVAVAYEARPYSSAEWDESVLVTFDRGWVRLTLPPPLAWQSGRIEVFDGTLTMPRVEDGPAFRKQAETFVSVCRGEQAPPSDAADALLDLELCDQAIALAAARGDGR